jgi:hypothetical protein
MSVTERLPGPAPVSEEDRRQFRRYWAVEACIAYVDYCVERYGQCPVYFNPMQCNFGAVVHHVDPAFYEPFYDGSTVTPTIRRHMQDRHG